MRHYLLTKFNAALPAFSIPMAIASVEIPKYGMAHDANVNVKIPGNGLLPSE